jgi:RNA polymerase sigma factor (sigma-70 family)
MVTETDADLVSAAAAGDPAALERLVSEYLPLLYNIVGRALPVAADVDDVVQETMLRVVRGLPGLRDPRVFRSWLVAVAMNQVRDHVRAYQGRPWPLDAAPDVADPGADFADLTLTELGLTGQRREVAMATAWLDDDDRELLSLWWLVEAGHLTRGDLVSAMALEPHHVTVRIARMKAQLEISRAVVRALCAAPICLELSDIAMQWHGRPEPLWRKRFARHTRQCPTCSGLAGDFVPAERLLVRLPLVPVPFGLADALHRVVPAAAHAAAQGGLAPGGLGQGEWGQGGLGHGGPGQGMAQSAAHSGAGGPGPGSHSHRRIGRAGAQSSHLAAKVAVAVAAAAAVIGAVVVTTGATDSKADSGPGNVTASSGTGGSADSASVTAPTPTDSLSTTGGSSTSGPPSTSPDSAKPDPSSSKSVMKSPSHSSAGASSSQSSTAGSGGAPSTPGSGTTSTSGGGSSQSDPASQVLAVINQARAGQGLPPLTLSAGLNKSAAGHTSVMASGCGLSHQCPGEAGLGDRETAAGVSWTSAGENIGDGGPVSNTNSAIASMAVGLTNSMLAEQPPDDGHRKNILSSSFRHIGISIYRDSSGTVWMTQDFSD